MGGSRLAVAEREAWIMMASSTAQAAIASTMGTALRNKGIALSGLAGRRRDGREGAGGRTEGQRKGRDDPWPRVRRRCRRTWPSAGPARWSRAA
jgi:hypothetical protein